VRQNSLKDTFQDTPKIIGWDAIGRVEATGPDAVLFKKGDLVYYAGDLTKPGCNQEYQLIDERIVGRAPQKISIEEAAAMPLTSLTAWELLFDHFRLSPDKDKGKSVLILGGAGGVGSIAIQLAKKVLGLNVIATASRPETQAWCKEMGADHVVNHRHLIAEMEAIGFPQVDLIADFVSVTHYWDAMMQLIKPFGQIGSISEPDQPVLMRQLKTKSVSFHWEFMFTRSMFETPDMDEQHKILNRIANLLDDGTLRSTVRTVLNGLSAETLKKAHAQLESGTTIGKLVIRF
jgi:NADPH2:quinone reductase